MDLEIKIRVVVGRHWLWIVLFPLIGLTYFATLREGHDWGGDFSIYLMQARNFAEGRQFDRNPYVATEESSTDHPAAYPPGASLLLAPTYALAGLDYVALKATLTVFLWLSLSAYYALAIRRGVVPAAAAITMSIFAFCPLILRLKETIGSDSLFLFLAGTTLLFIEVSCERQWDHRYPVRTALAAVVLLVLCYATRAIGLCLIAAFSASELLRMRCIRRFGVTAAAALTVSLVLYTAFVYRVSHHYGTQFRASPVACLQNAVFSLKCTAVIWATFPASTRYVLAAATLGFAIIGWARQLRRFTIVELYVTSCFAVVIIYSGGQNMRYLVPALPLMLMYAMQASCLIVNRAISWHLGKRLASAAAIMLVSWTIVLDARSIDTRPIREGILEPSFVEVCSFLRSKTPPDALILSWNPRVFALYTGKLSALYPDTADPAEFLRRAPAKQPAFFVSFDRDPNQNRLRNVIERLQPGLAFANRDYRVYVLVKR